MSDYYRLLGLERNATAEEISAAYARARARLRWDSAQDDAESAARSAALEEAYATLSDPVRRAAYDGVPGPGTQATGLVPVAQPSAPAIPESVSPLAAHQACPRCGALNPSQATLCAACGAQLARPCPHCGQRVTLSETVCPRCATVIAEYDQRRFGEALLAEQRILQERQEMQAKGEAADATYRAHRQLAVVFWLVAAVLCVGLVVLASVLSDFSGQ